MTLNGIYRDGRIELAEKPPVPEGTEVRVTIEPQPSPAHARSHLYRGMFANPTRPYSTEEDFKRAEWHGEDQVLDE